MGRFLRRGEYGDGKFMMRREDYPVRIVRKRDTEEATEAQNPDRRDHI